MKKITLFVLRFYKIFVSPIFVGFFGHGCKYSPTCSEYLYESIQRFGIIKGTPLGVKRFLSCNPFSKGGFDPVPTNL